MQANELKTKRKDSRRLLVQFIGVGDYQLVMNIAAGHGKELSVLHHCLEVSNLYDACLVVLCEVGQVGIATDDVFGANGIGQREEVEVFRVADG